jgi:hypothetical protein
MDAEALDSGGAIEGLGDFVLFGESPLHLSADFFVVIDYKQSGIH